MTFLEGNDLIKSLREPGGNITGVRYPGPDLARRRFEILHELAPQAKRMWVPYTKHSPIVPDQLTALRPAAAKAGVSLVESPADRGADLIADLDTRAQSADIVSSVLSLIQQVLMNLLTNARDALNERYPEYSPEKKFFLFSPHSKRKPEPDWVFRSATALCGTMVES